MTVTFSVYGPNDNAGDPVIIIGPKDLTFRTDLASTASGKGAALVAFLQSGTGAVARTLLAKAREVVSVKDFGAVGDGTTNDTAAIQATIDHLVTLGGGTAFFPVGTYKTTSPIYTYDSVILAGCGAVSRIKKSGTTAGSGSNVSPSAGAVADSYAVDAVVIAKHDDDTFNYYGGIYDLDIEGDDAYTTDYAVYAPRISQWNIRNVGLLKCNTGWITYDGWLTNFDRVTADPYKIGSALAAEKGVSASGPSGTTIGFHWAKDGAGGGTGTSISWRNCWARRCDTGYKINNVAYSSMLNCAADDINVNPYYFETCNSMSVVGCGFESSMLGPGLLFSAGKYSVIGFRGATNIYGVNGSAALRAEASATVTIMGSLISDFTTVNSALNRIIQGGAIVTEIDTTMPTNGNSYLSLSSSAVLSQYSSGEWTKQTSVQTNGYKQKSNAPGGQLFGTDKSIASGGTAIMTITAGAVGSRDFASGKIRMFYTDQSYPNGAGFIEAAFSVYRETSSYYQNVTAGVSSFCGNAYITAPAFSIAESAGVWTITVTPTHGAMNAEYVDVEWFEAVTGDVTVALL